MTAAPPPAGASPNPSAAAPRPTLRVLAGTNGAGKSSVAGALLRQSGADWFNPDEVARKLIAANPGLGQREANGLAWTAGKTLLERAIAGRLDFNFETTLGASTLPALLATAADAGFAVRIWYVGLASVELHLKRVRERVAKGGHDIPEADIRRRYDAGRRNLIALLPRLAELKLFDNSAEGDPQAGSAPAPRALLHWRDGKLQSLCAAEAMPDWARPIAAAVLRLAAAR
ncbi:AAA family ATPase [Derxia lacustris]|uniref:AAA family ATPase n=1 Tax=Derxia lacustris TaxID=764842 RepID=UPI000A17554D|nr:AAA family ATPase [Derxia lacustris]